MFNNLILKTLEVDHRLSTRQEHRITCPRCGRLVPAMSYCIYCGTKLPKPTPPPVLPRPAAPQTPPSKAPPLVPAPTVAPPVRPQPLGVNPEIRDLMSNISVYEKRRVALLDLFRKGEISERVFVKLYGEYSSKLNESLNQRVSKLEEFREQLSQKRSRLDEIRFSLEELEARHKVGEIDASVFEERSRGLKDEAEKLESEMKSLQSNINHLERVFSDKAPKEILNLETRVKAFYESLERFISEGKISRESVDKIKPDLEEDLRFFDSIIGERKERERQLREQLEALHARYRVSEISIEEYERRKREIQEEIDKIWGISWGS